MNPGPSSPDRSATRRRVSELPVVVLVLTSLGLVTPAFLRAKRRHAIVLITVLASFLSPGDYISVTLLLMAPLILLYELSIVLSVFVDRRRRARLDSTGPPEESVPFLSVLGLTTARWRNRRQPTVTVDGV